MDLEFMQMKNISTDSVKKYWKDLSESKLSKASKISKFTTESYELLKRKNIDYDGESTLGKEVNIVRSKDTGVQILDYSPEKSLGRRNSKNSKISEGVE